MGNKQGSLSSPNLIKDLRSVSLQEIQLVFKWWYSQHLQNINLSINEELKSSTISFDLGLPLELEKLILFQCLSDPLVVISKFGTISKQGYKLSQVIWKGFCLEMCRVAVQNKPDIEDYNQFLQELLRSVSFFNSSPQDKLEKRFLVIQSNFLPAKPQETSLSLPLLASFAPFTLRGKYIRLLLKDPQMLDQYLQHCLVKKDGQTLFHESVQNVVNKITPKYTEIEYLLSKEGFQDQFVTIFSLAELQKAHAIDPSRFYYFNFNNVIELRNPDCLSLIISCLRNQFSFPSVSICGFLRRAFMHIKFVGESQIISTIFETLSEEYLKDSLEASKQGTTPYLLPIIQDTKFTCVKDMQDALFTFFFGSMMLSIDHAQATNVNTRMKKAAFINNLTGILSSEQDDFVGTIFDEISFFGIME